MAKVTAFQMWPPNSPNLRMINYSIRGVMQEGVYYNAKAKCGRAAAKIDEHTG